MAAAVDTNILLRLLLDDDPEQTPAARAFHRTQGPLFLSHAVLLEASWVLTSGYGFGRDQLATLLKMLLDADGFVVQEPPVVQAAVEAFRHCAADFADCLILATARSAGMLPLGTFDRKLAKLEGARKLGGKRR